MIELPSVKPNNLTTVETDFGSSISASIWRKIVNNHNWVEKNLPVGFVLFFHASTSSAEGIKIEKPNPKIWTLIDGKTINDPESPLNGATLPNFLDLFPKGFDQEGLTGGNYTLNIKHSHGGRTGITDDTEDKVTDTGGGANSGSPHYHSISEAWSTEEPIIPIYFSVQPYIRFK